METEWIRWLSVADRYAKMDLDRQLAPLGLNSSQHMYVLRICREPGVQQDQLSEIFHIHPSNVTRSIAYLEKEGFLHREQNPRDKRTCRLYPTSRAQQACDRIAAICENWQCAVTEDFTDEEIRMLDKLLQRVVHSALSRADSQNAGEGGQG